MDKSVFYLGLVSIGLLTITLFFMDGITGNVVLEERERYMNLSFFIFLALIIAIIEVVRYYTKDRKKEIDIKKLIQESTPK